MSVCSIGHVATYLLLTLDIVAMKIMRENRVVWNVAFKSHVQSLVQENCTLLCRSHADSTVEVKFYSSSDFFRKERVALAKNEIPPELIAGFVTCLHEENWWLACVLEVCSDTKEVKLTFLHPHGPSNSFKYPEPQNIHTMPMDAGADPGGLWSLETSLQKYIKEAKRVVYWYKNTLKCIIS